MWYYMYVFWFFGFFLFCQINYTKFVALDHHRCQVLLIPREHTRGIRSRICRCAVVSIIFTLPMSTHYISSVEWRVKSCCRHTNANH